MEKRCFNAAGAPPAAGPYSHAVAAGNLLFVSGQVSLAPDGSGPIRGSFEIEARRMLDNLKIILEECGSGLEHVIKTTVFLKDMERFGELNAIYSEYFGEAKPARSCVEVARLPANFQCEIEAIALLPGAG